MNEKVIAICPDCGCEYTTTKANLVKFAQRGETACPACRFKKVKAHKDVDVRFEDGFVLKHARMTQFNNGTLKGHRASAISY